MISIIIPAHNEELFIKHCINSIIQQKFKDYEIIVVCDYCNDNTKKIAKKYTKRVYSVNFMNVSKTKNYGAKKAKGNILVFLDADSIISKNLLFEINKYTNKGYIGGVTKTLSLENKLKAHIIWFIGNLGRYFFIAASGMLFCKKDKFSGFDEDKKIAEDTYLILKLKKRGKLKYLTNCFIKTSARRMEKLGYIKTIYTQFKGFFIKSFNQY